MREPRLRVKSLTRDERRDLLGRTEYTAWYRFRTGAVRVPRSCRECGSVFPGHRCGGVPRD